MGGGRRRKVERLRSKGQNYYMLLVVKSTLYNTESEFRINLCCCAEQESTFCATKSADRLNPYFAHNIHVHVHVCIELTHFGQNCNCGGPGGGGKCFQIVLAPQSRSKVLTCSALLQCCLRETRSGKAM